jgi:hypothetical protein
MLYGGWILGVAGNKNDAKRMLILIITFFSGDIVGWIPDVGCSRQQEGGQA